MILSKKFPLFPAILLVAGLGQAIGCRAQDTGRTQDSVQAPMQEQIPDPVRFAGLDQWMDDNAAKIGGRAILVIDKGGRHLYSKSVNEMSRRQKMVNKFVAKRMHQTADGDDYTAGSRQPIASCSKWLSAALVMTFVDEGKLQLSDTVGKYLPVLSQHGKGMITMSQCLSHLTGIREPSLKESLKPLLRAASMDEAIAWIATLPMEGQPGAVFHYSNAGLQIAAAVLEKISGKSFEILFAERIARPLDMANTDFGKGPVALPAGGAGSTPDDYMKFLNMILHKGMANGHRVLSQRSVAEMQVNRVSPGVRIAYSPAGMENIGYGYGEWILLDPQTKAPSGAVTSPGLFGSIPWVDNERGYSAFLMTFYLDNKGRQQRLVELKRTVDEAMDGKVLSP